MQDFADDIKKEAQEELKVKLEVLLKSKYGIVLTDEDWHELCN